MNGFDVIAEIDSQGVLQLARAHWKSNNATADFSEVEIEREVTHRVWPPLIDPAEPVENGLALNVRYKLTRAAFPEGNLLSLPPGEMVEIRVYADAADRASVQLITSISIDARAELRYPGPLTPYRQFGDFIMSNAQAVVLAEAAMERGINKKRDDVLFVDPAALELKDLIFMEGQRPPDHVLVSLRALVAELLPLLGGQGEIPLSPKINKLCGNAGMELAPGHPLITFRSMRGGTDVTGGLMDEERFDSGVRTFISIGAGFGFRGLPHRSPGELDARPRRLADRPDEHVALSVSNWFLRYVDVVHLGELVRDAFNDAIIKSKGEEPQAKGEERRYKSRRDWAMYRVYTSKPHFTEDDDDGVIVIRSVSGLRVNHGVLHSKAVIYQIQRGLFDWDWIQPDIDFDVEVSLKLKANPAEPTKLRVDVILVKPHRTNPLWERALTIITSFDDLIKSAFKALDALVSWDVEALRAAGWNLLDFAVNLLVALAPLPFVILQMLKPDMFDKDQPIPKLEFSGTKELLTLTFHVDPITELDERAELDERGVARDEGITYFARIKVT